MTLLDNKILFLFAAGVSFSLMTWCPLWFLVTLTWFPNLIWVLVVYLGVGGMVAAGLLLAFYLHGRLQVKGAPREQ